MNGKKKGMVFFLAFVIMLLAGIPVFAENAVGKVYDFAGLFSEEEKTALQRRAEDIQENCGLELVFLTTESTGGIEARRYAADFYEQNGFDLDGGVIMIVDMGERDAQIVTCGKAIDIFTDYYINRIWNGMRDMLSEGEYFDAMETLCGNVEYYYAEYQKYQENPEYVSQYQQEQQKRGMGLALAKAGIFSLVAAGIGVAFLRRGAKNVKPYTDGRAYLKENGVVITADENTFVTTHTAMTPIPKNDDHSGGSWGGGSSTFHSSSGRSFGGGGGRF